MIDKKIDNKIEAALSASLLSDYLFRAESHQVLKCVVIEKELFDMLNELQKDEYNERIEEARRPKPV